MQAAAVGAIVWLTLINPLNVARQNELVTVSLSELNGINATSFVVSAEGKVLPSQQEDTDFDGKVDSVAFLVDLEPEQSLKVSIKSAESKTVPAKAHAEISVRATQPEAKGDGVKVSDGKFVSKKQLVQADGHKLNDGWYRFEGPLIESDKIGYRLYWDGRGAIDAYGKVSDQSVGGYHRGNHHTMQSWGRDILHNGKALGVGGLAVGIDEKRFSPLGAPYSKVIVGSDGPIRASYRVECKQIKYQGGEYDLVWDISMSAGKRYVTHSVKVIKGTGLPILAGLTNHSDEKNVTGKYSWAKPNALDWVATYGKQVYPDSDAKLAATSKEQMGMGLLWDHKQLADFDVSDLEFDALFKTGEVKYYSLVAYNGEKESPIVNDKQFYAYMNELSKCLANPVIVKVEK